MYKWFDAAKADEYPKRPVLLQATTLGDALEMRAAKGGDDMDMVFDPETELGNLWLTMVQSGLNVRSVHLSLFDKSGNKIKPDIPHPTKEDDEYGYAYTVAQLKAFPVPQNLFMLKHRFGAPCLSVSATPYTPKERSTPTRRKAERVAITRATATPALNALAAPATAATAGKPKLVRAK